MTENCPGGSSCFQGEKHFSGQHVTFFMKEFMLVIKNDIDHQVTWSAEKHLQFVKECEHYIMKLKEDGRLVAGTATGQDSMIYTPEEGWNVRSMRPKGEVQVGYYHILANDMDDAITLAEGNPGVLLQHARPDRGPADPDRGRRDRFRLSDERDQNSTLLEEGFQEKIMDLGKCLHKDAVHCIFLRFWSFDSLFSMTISSNLFMRPAVAPISDHSTALAM